MSTPARLLPGGPGSGDEGPVRVSPNLFDATDDTISVPFRMDAPPWPAGIVFLLAIIGFGFGAVVTVITSKDFGAALALLIVCGVIYLIGRKIRPPYLIEGTVRCTPEETVITDNHVNKRGLALMTEAIQNVSVQSHEDDLRHHQNNPDAKTPPRSQIQITYGQKEILLPGATYDRVYAEQLAVALGKAVGQVQAAAERLDDEDRPGRG